MTPDGAPRQPLSPKTQGYFALACVVVGMILFGIYGPNDIWTSLLVGAVMGGIAARPLLNVLLRVRSWIGTLRR